MGHVTTDRLDEAWRAFNRAESLVDDGQTFGAVEKCISGLRSVQRAAGGMGKDELFVRNDGEELLQRALRLERENVPDEEEVTNLIEVSREFTRGMKEPIVDELHDRLEDEYDKLPTCSRF